MIKDDLQRGSEHVQYQAALSSALGSHTTARATYADLRTTGVEALFRYQEL